MLSRLLLPRTVTRITFFPRFHHNVINNHLNDHIKVVVVPHSTEAYSYVVVNQAKLTCFAIDCGDSDLLSQAIDMQDSELVGIFNTHGHITHCKGNKGLKEKYPKVPFFGPNSELLNETNTDIIKAGDTFEVVGFNFKIHDGSYHSEDSVLIEYDPIDMSPMIFTGDTICYASTGNLVEGKEDILYHFIYDTLKEYPLSTSFYFDHEQSYKSLQFSRFIERKNKYIFDHKEWVKQQLGKGNPTTPTSLQKELFHNPFFRAEDPELQKYMKISDPYELFKVIYDKRVHYEEIRPKGILGKIL